MDRDRADGFIMPDGEFIAVTDVDRMYTVAGEALENPQEVMGMMIGMARDCERKGKFEYAEAYLRKAILASETAEQKAYCLLLMGLLKERQDDYAGARDAYLEAFDLEPAEDDTWYFLNNNTGYCLNQLGTHSAAEGFCRRAIAIDPDRHNAHKNLGVALEGLGRYPEAIRSYLTAAESCPQDTRALQLLEKLLAAHPDAGRPVPDLPARLDACRAAVEAAGN